MSFPELSGSVWTGRDVATLESILAERDEAARGPRPVGVPEYH